MNFYLKRLGAFFIDIMLALLSLSLFLFAYRVFLLEPETSKQANYMLICAILTLCFLFIYLPTKANGQTIGKLLFHLRVVNLDGTQRTWYQNFLRECVLKFSFLTILLPLDIIYAIINCIKEQTLQLRFAHDLWLHTCVKE